MLIIDIADSIGTITLDRESRRNALCEEMVQAFVAALASFTAAGVRCVVFRAKPGSKVWSGTTSMNCLPLASTPWPGATRCASWSARSRPFRHRSSP